MTEFVALTAKRYPFAYLNNEDQLEKHKNAKGTKKCVINNHVNFDLYKKVLINNRIIRCSQQRFKSDYHVIYTQTVHKNALNNEDHKKKILFNRITTYSYGMDNELIIKLKKKIKKNQYNFITKN